MAEESGAQTSTSSSNQSPPLDSPDVESKVPPHGVSKAMNGNIPTFMYPGLFPSPQDQELVNRGPGLYAVPVHSYTQPMPWLPSNALIPFTYNVPTERSSSETRSVGTEQAPAGEQLQQQQQGGPQRQVVVRRFQIAIQLDLLLILKLAAVIFLFNQDGSRLRLVVLIFFASLIYLYQTGALAPIVRWLSQGMQRAAAPPQRPRPVPRADNLAAAGGQGNENENMGVADDQPAGENNNHQINNENRAVENDHAAEPGQVEAINGWWRIAKEIQMIVFGFITSLLPGFHNID
ncbi:uncharacterized protein LOC127239968 [Andrographis paniculata]|uniref:uncharacterized protein LOC127239968 n=1 Tax=Andrographis paniculata TaxID=175694 RepID=UPI0021E86E15|nr:uncharacterized protein LOC127239968 [Andrographis paniculata]